MRTEFEQQLLEIRSETINLGSMVDKELQLALKALNELDVDMVDQIFKADKEVNKKRFSIEDQCTALVNTQQLTASDIRAILAAINMIVDLERMGDHAKSVAKVIPHVSQSPEYSQPPELKQMGEIVLDMLRGSMEAYIRGDIGLAKQVPHKDNEVDRLFAQLFTTIMDQLAETNDQEQIKTIYQMLHAGRELERFGDLTTNVAERVIYLATGVIYELNVDSFDMIADDMSAEQPD